ncbi:CHAT domain-containing protein [Aquimarina muelleri]|uniref:Tetratricopeptide repeat domain protein n=1 Tax=Aquimarina muelleri TaxID=279356 RepID=A0A918JUR6_9FLAO|nr:CHAT domain-containing protein [Aquimarina muelleri]MCX2761724.1 CHAT domain-containing protein [Aquimarina muelleri]GGX15698.1 tetratricopeptide repeat domain protein [Aquimarina muelleri]
MKYRLVVYLYLFTFFSYSQDYKIFQKKLSPNIPLEIAEQKIDSFVNNATKILPPIEIADHYHEYGLWYFQKWNIIKDITLLEKAFFYTEKSKNIKKAISNIDQQSLNKTLYNLGHFSFRKHDFFEAIKYYSEIIKANGTKKRLLFSHIALGETYTKIGDFHKALHILEKGIELAGSDKLYQKNIIDGYIQLADTYSLMGYEEYSSEIQSNLQKADSILDLVSFNTIRHKNYIYQIEGNRLLKTKKYLQANFFFHKTLENLYSGDSYNKAITYNSLGVSFHNLRKLDSAQFYIQKSISVAPNFTPAHENMGDLYIEQKDFIKGLQAYQKAIDYSVSNDKNSGYKNLITIQELEVTVNKYDLLHHLIQKANGWMQYYLYDKDKNHLIEALETFKLADKLVDIIRFESTEYKSKLFWREQGASLYRKAVETCYLLKKPEEAYYFMEKNKALLLLEDITNEQAKENTKLPVVIAKREFALKKEIYLSENELNSSQKQPKDSIQIIKDKVYKNKRLYEQFVDSISKIYPEYAVNKKKITVLPHYTFTTKYILEDEVVLQYILDKDHGYGLLTSSNKSIFFEIKDVPVLIEDIKLLRKQSSQWFVHQEQVTAYQKNANSIFQKLIPPSVHTLVKGKKITIVPDYTLQQISFDALTTSAQPHSYFIKDAEIRYAYSMSYLDRKEQVTNISKYPFIGFAPVTFSNNKLGDLPLSKDEVLSISSLYNGDTILEEKATKANFLDTIQAYKVIHLSTHADIGDIVDPWIAFRDQKLSLHEIYATKNQSDMVVLSACKTSLGELKLGEGIMSLARGFFHSGAKSVVSSLWATNDKSSQELMLDFYKKLDKGETKASALRNAKLDYIRTHTGSELSPFYWGSLILIGDNSPITLSQNTYYWYWAGSLALLMLIISVFYIRRKKQKG